MRLPLMTWAVCLTVAAGCTKTGMAPDEDGGGSVEECLESNIIYNGNISLYSYNRWPSYEPVNNRRRSEIIRHIGLLGGIGSREAIWNSYGSIEPISYGESFDFQYNDKVFNELSAAGLRYCLQMKVDALVVNPDDYGPQWQRNLEWYTGLLARHYGDAPLYYIPMNEPDNEGQRTDGTPALTTGQILRVQQVVYETLKGYNENIKVASSPLCLLQDESEYGYTSSGRQVLLAGITRYCDYFAFHKHVDIGEDGRYSETDLWRYMDEAEAAGYPRRPALVNENGTRLTLPLVWPEATEEDARQFKSYWIGNDLIQMKSLGLKYIVPYSLAGSLSNDGEYNIIQEDTLAGDGSYIVHRLEYDAYRELWNPFAHRLSAGINGGFEEANPDKSRGWVVSFRGRSFNGIGRVEPKEWDYVSIVRENARSGDFCLEMRPIDFEPEASIDSRGITANRCRRLVEGLVPGRSYKVSAWVRLGLGEDGSSSGSPSVVLRAMGSDPLGKSRPEVSADSAGSSGDYVLLEVSFTAWNPWVVISLEHNGEGFAWWDDVAVSME